MSVVRLRAAANASELTAKFKELGVPPPPPGLFREHMDTDLWRKTHDRIGHEDASHKRLQVESLLELQVCPVCRGSKDNTRYDSALRLHLEVTTPTHAAAEACLACGGAGRIPTKRGVRRCTEYVQADIHQGEVTTAASRKVYAVLRDMAAQPADWWAEADGPVATVGVGVDTTAERLVEIRTAADAQAAIAELVDDLKELEVLLHRDKLVFEDLQVLAPLVAFANDMDKWCTALEQYTPAVPPPPPAAPAVPVQVCCECGKPATVQGPGGLWYCKRHGYAAGAVEHTADKLRTEVVTICDWCEQRRAVRQYGGYHYCGPCADDAGLPPQKLPVVDDHPGYDGDK